MDKAGTRMKRLAVAAAFVGTVYAANWALTRWGVVPVGFGLHAPAGVFFAGLAFGLRDVLDDLGGRRWVLAAIVAGALLSYWLGASATIPGGHVSIALASALAFSFSELCDYAVYTPIRARHHLRAVAASNVVGAAVDSALFITLAFGSLALFWGQFWGKTLMVLPVVAVMAARKPVAA